jgi:hypothetical protein
VSERIICAAIWVDDGIVHPHQPKNIDRGLVVCGRRHHNCIVVANVAFPGMAVDRDQGFVTTADRYVDREEAASIAIAAGQVDRAQMEYADTLFSEDLY